MRLSGAVKKLPGAVILIAEAVMFWLIAVEISLETLPIWHKWIFRLTAGLFAAFFAVSVLVYIFCDIKGKIPALFWIWGIACLTTANTLHAAPGWLLAVLGAMLMLHMILRGIYGSTVSSAVVLAVFVICAMLSIVFIPSISRIEKPKMVSRMQDLWWELFENESGSSAESTGTGTPTLSPDAMDGSDDIPDNMITNDPFPEDDDTPVCTVMATYPLDRLQVFSCGNYDPSTFSFLIGDDVSVFSGGRSPSSNYYKQVLDGSVELPYKAVITDHRTYNNMMLVPYCSFTCSSEGAIRFGDRCIYRNALLPLTASRYTFEPEEYYRSIASGYNLQAHAEYVDLPSEFAEKVTRFIIDRGLHKEGIEPADLISSVREMLSSEYTFSYVPPELPDGEDPVLWFLFESKTGYSKHFAAAEVFLYRAMGIPARYSFGYDVKKYVDGSAEVERRDYCAFCEVFVNGAWMLPEDVLKAEGHADVGKIGPEVSTESSESEGAVILANGYDISHLKGTASMFGSYEAGQSYSVSRNAREQDDTVVLIVDTGADADYIKAYSTGEYSYGEGTFVITSDTGFAPEFEEGKSYGEYAASAFMSSGEDAPDASKGFRVFNLYAPRYVYAPVFTVSTKGLSRGQEENFGMKADRMIVPLSEGASYDDLTVYEGGETAGANKAYMKYALSKYTSVPDQLLYELKQFLKKNGIDPDDPDKGVLLEKIRSLLGSYTYTTQIETIPEEEDPVTWFLNESKSGYCVHFAAAGTMLLRACGIPARYVSGFLKEIPAGTVAEVTVQDAHAWTEVFDGSSWTLVEMCVGRPAEGQTLPAGIRADVPSYSLPSDRTQWFSGDDVPSWTGCAAAAVTVCVLAAVIAVIYRKNRPDTQQKAAIAYKYIKKYYYISDDMERLLNKMNYSREGAQPDDMKTMAKYVAKARSLLLYRHKYLSFATSMIVYAFWHLEAVAENIASRFRAGKDPSRRMAA